MTPTLQLRIATRYKAGGPNAGFPRYAAELVQGGHVEWLCRHEHRTNYQATECGKIELRARDRAARGTKK